MADINMKGSLLVHKTAKDFSGGRHDGTTIKNYGYDVIELVRIENSYVKNGIYTSEVIKTEPFRELVMSWNTDTPRGTSISVEAQICVGGKWSKWLSWGIWTTFEENASIEDDSDPIAYVDADTMVVRDPDKAASAMRYRITLNSTDVNSTPAVRLIAAAIRMPDRENGIPQVLAIDYPKNKNIDEAITKKIIEMPSYSQMIRDPQIGSVICSATCLSMILNFYGIKITPEEAAWGVWDNVYDGAGNWPYNCAYAGSLGMEAYVAFMNSIDDIKREILLGHPVEVSVAYRNDESVDRKLPVLHNAPTDYTAGHLIIICGFEKENGQDYLIAHDPAAKDNEGVKVRYLVKEFEEAWRKRTAYIIHPGDGGAFRPAKIQGTLEFTGIIEQKDQSYCAGFILKHSKKTAYMDSNNVRTIMYTSDEGQNWSYIKPDSAAVCLWFETAKPKGEYNFIIILKNKLVFEARLNWTGI